MWIAALTSCLAVAVGAGLALGGIGSRAMVPLRSFALAAVVATVVAHLLPEALTEGGAGVLALFVAAALAPAALARITSGRGDRNLHRGPSRSNGLAVELAYASLLLHKVTDGVALGSAVGTGHTGHHHWDVVLAVAGHTVPMAATVALTYRSRGARVAWLRTAGLAVAMVAGAAAADGAERIATAGIAPWLNAIAAGLLLHVVIHDLPAPGARRAGGRLLELAAIAIGVALPLMSGEAHGHDDGPGVAAALGQAVVDLAAITAPALALGLLAAAVVQTFAPRRPLSWLERPRALGAAVRGAVIGSPSPGCSCGIQPVAETLDRRGGSAAAMVAFALATPVVGVETLAVGGQLLGWPLAAIRLAAAVAAAVIVAVVAARLAAGRGHAHAGAHAGSHRPRRVSHMPASEVAATGSRLRMFVDVLDDLVVHTAPWILAGGAVAVYAQALVPDGILATIRWPLTLALVVAIAVPSHVCASAAVPLAAVLIGKGLGPGAALAGLLLGPIAGSAIIALLRRSLGSSAAAIAIALFTAIVAGVAVIVDSAGRDLVAGGGNGLARLAPGTPWLSWAAMAVLLAMAIHTVWRGGLSAWVAALHGHHEHEEGDGHGHTHDHGHGPPHDHDHH